MTSRTYVLLSKSKVLAFAALFFASSIANAQPGNADYQVFTVTSSGGIGPSAIVRSNPNGLPIEIMSIGNGYSGGIVSVGDRLFVAGANRTGFDAPTNIEEYSLTGEFRGVFAGPFSQPQTRPGYLESDSRGSIYFPTVGIARRIAPNGEVLSIFTLISTSFFAGMDGDADGNFYTYETFGTVRPSLLRKFSADGTELRDPFVLPEYATMTIDEVRGRMYFVGLLGGLAEYDITSPFPTLLRTIPTPELTTAVFMNYSPLTDSLFISGTNLTQEHSLDGELLNTFFAPYNINLGATVVLVPEPSMVSWVATMTIALVAICRRRRRMNATNKTLEVCLG